MWQHKETINTYTWSDTLGLTPKFAGAILVQVCLVRIVSD